MNLATIIERSQREKESWRYTNVRALLKERLDTPVAANNQTQPSSLLPSIIKNGAQRHQIVFVNGIWKPELTHLNDVPVSIISGDADKGYQLTLEGKMCLITMPIELVFVTLPTDDVRENTTTLNITVGESGRLTLIEHHLSAGVHNQPIVAKIIDTDIHLGAQAKLVHGKIVHGDTQTAHLTSTRVHIAKGAYYDNFELIKGGKLVRNEIDVTLDGPLAQCSLNGIMLLRGHEHADTTTHITHVVPHGTSREMYKTVVSDQARGVFQGKILVKKGAQKTDGQQLSKALLLSDQAEMDARPELEIYADDVKCSHGSTVGDLDDDALFYLRARGLSESDARALLIAGFVDELINDIKIDEWRDFCHIEVEAWLHEQK